jgi:hypothetical protein
MVRGRRRGRRRGARGGGVTPPTISTPEGSNPQGGQQVLGQEQIAVADVVVMMRSFQCMSEALISRMDREEARAPTPAEVPLHALAVTGSIHRELEKVKFPEFFGAPDGAAAEAWLENMAMCFRTSRLYLQHEGLHGGLSTKGERSSMVEDAPTAAEHGRRRRVMGTIRGTVLGEVSFRGIH